ncbi:MAG: hypothetical protein CEN92_90 [Candidatus Berkelbacteria bacterium Licking1014_96]|uniref:Uncharacterized protein n=1 Tax=Candidatus Berkelbacteria bacterium Licking1014_96 TaxID=2017149 RepID=A0A554LH49_9BACT|nr:MAG: hypothetical protein CEN92_90 [Candidatus Berkelbacteria bacterium Licking1014_96]
MAPLALVVLSIVGTAQAAPVVGDLNSNNNDLSWMVSVSRPWDGTNADLNGQLTDTLPTDVPATVTFKPGTFRGGTYRGWLHRGDFVFYKVVEVRTDGESREIVRAGRCGNPATGRYFVPKPQLPEAPPPCAPTTIVIPPPPPLPALPPVINFTPRVECPPTQCPAPVVNVSCPQPERPAPRQPHAGAKVVRYNYGGADIMLGRASRDTRRIPRLCHEYPPWNPWEEWIPPVRPAPPW